MATPHPHPAYANFTLKNPKNNRTLAVDETTKGFDLYFYVNDKITGQPGVQGVLSIQIDDSDRNEILVSLEQLVAHNQPHSNRYLSRFAHFEPMKLDLETGLMKKTGEKVELRSSGSFMPDFKLSQDVRVEPEGFRFFLRRYDQSGTYCGGHKNFALPLVTYDQMGIDLDAIRREHLETETFENNAKRQDDQLAVYRHLTSMSNLETSRDTVAFIMEMNRNIKSDNIVRALQILESGRIQPDSRFYAQTIDSEFSPPITTISCCINPKNAKDQARLLAAAFKHGHFISSFNIGLIESNEIFKVVLEGILPHEPWTHQDWPTIIRSEWLDRVMKVHLINHADKQDSSNAMKRDRTALERYKLLEDHGLVSHRQMLSNLLKLNNDLPCTLDHVASRAAPSVLPPGGVGRLPRSQQIDFPVHTGVTYHKDAMTAKLVKLGFEFDSIDHERAKSKGMLETAAAMDYMRISDQMKAEAQTKSSFVSRASI